MFYRYNEIEPHDGYFNFYCSQVLRNQEILLQQCGVDMNGRFRAWWQIALISSFITGQNYVLDEIKPKHQPPSCEK